MVRWCQARGEPRPLHKQCVLAASWLNTAILGLKVHKFTPDVETKGKFILNSVDGDVDMECRGYVKFDPHVVITRGLVRHSASTNNGTSGAAAWSLAGRTKLAFCHLGGLKSYEHSPDPKHPNVAVPGTVNAQLYKKFNGIDSSPVHVMSDEKLGFALHEEWRLDEELEKLEQAAGAAGLTVVAQPVTDDQDGPEGKVSARIWKAAVSRMRRKKVSKKHTIALLYAKIFQRVPEFDGTLSKEQLALRKPVSEACLARLEQVSYMYGYICVFI